MAKTMTMIMISTRVMKHFADPAAADDDDEEGDDDDYDNDDDDGDGTGVTNVKR